MAKQKLRILDMQENGLTDAYIYGQKYRLELN